TFSNLSQQLPKVRDDLTKLGDTFDKASKELDENKRKLDWERLPLYTLVGSTVQAYAENIRKLDWDRLQQHARQGIAGAAELLVVQSQIRVYLIELKPIPAQLDEATAYARDN